MDHRRDLSDDVVVLPPFVWVRLPGTGVEVRNHEDTRDIVVDPRAPLADLARHLPEEAVLSFRWRQE